MKRTLFFAAILATFVSPAAADAKRYNLLLSFGQDVLVVGKDDVSIRAQCVQNEAGFDIIRVYADTANNAVMHASYTGTDYTGNGSYLTGMTPVLASTIFSGATNTGLEFFSSQIDAGTVLNLTTMRGFTVNVESAVLGVNGGPSDCTLSMNVDTVKKFKEAS